MHKNIILMWISLIVITLSAVAVPRPAALGAQPPPPDQPDIEGILQYLPNISAQYPWASLTAWSDFAFFNRQVYQLKVGPEAGWVWAITQDGLFRSKTEGRHWQKTQAGLPGSPNQIAVPELGRSNLPLFATWGSSVYISTNYGDSWQLDKQFTHSFQLIDYDGETPMLGVSTSPVTIFKRTTTGQWEQVGPALSGGLYDLASYKGSLFAATSMGLFKLADNSWLPVTVAFPGSLSKPPTTWVNEWMAPKIGPQIEQPTTDPQVTTILVSGVDLYIGTYGGRGVYRSSDGITWTALDVGLTQPYTHDIRHLALSSSGLLFAGGQDGAFVSPDRGGHWQALDQGLLHSITAYGSLLDGVSNNDLVVIREGDEGVTVGAVFNNQTLKYLTISPTALLQPTSVQSPPKAVLVVGPVDPPGHSTTKSFIDWANQLAAIMERNGMQVVKVYWPDSTWENVRAAISGASIIVYKGHGFGLGDIPVDPTEMVGSVNGFCLVNPMDPAGARLGTQDMLTATNRLAHNAVAFFFCCYCAGASSSDSSPVSEALARRRIEAYSATLVQMGGAGYYSGVDEAGIVEDLFRYPDKTLGEIYASHGGSAGHVYNHILWPTLSVWFDGSTSSGWGRAFVGNPNLRAGDIWQP